MSIQEYISTKSGNPILEAQLTLLQKLHPHLKVFLPQIDCNSETRSSNLTMHVSEDLFGSSAMDNSLTLVIMTLAAQLTGTAFCFTEQQVCLIKEVSRVTFKEDISGIFYCQTMIVFEENQNKAIVQIQNKFGKICAQAVVILLKTSHF
jgi:hypothetical protein